MQYSLNTNKSTDLIFRTGLALILTAFFYMLVIEIYMVPPVMESFSQTQIDDMLFMEQYGLISTSMVDNVKEWIKNLAISRLLSEEEGVIFGIYIAIYLSFLMHIFMVLNRNILPSKQVDQLMTFTVYATPTFGTIGTMYAVAVALSVQGTEMISTNQIIKAAFFDAIYTTIVGLSVSLICLLISGVFYKRIES